MSIPAIDSSNVAALIAAFRIANAPAPSGAPLRAPDVARGGELRPVQSPSVVAGPAAPVAGAAVKLPATPIISTPFDPLPSVASLRIVPPPEPATLVTISSRPPPASILMDAVPLPIVLTAARQALDSAYLGAAGGARLAAVLIARAPIAELFETLDRRALFAVAFEAPELFSPEEREVARVVLVRQALSILSMLKPPLPGAAWPEPALQALVVHLDAAGPEERRSTEWIIQRAAVQHAQGRAAPDAIAGASMSGSKVETVRTAFEAFARGVPRIDGPPPVSTLRDMPLFGTAFLSPEMLLVGLVAVGRPHDRTSKPDQRRKAARRARPDDDAGFLIRPLEADWESVPDAAPALESWEASSGLRLPADYRAFLLAHNGGRIYPNMFAYAVPLLGASSTGAMTFLDQLYGWAHVQKAWEGETFGNRLPPGFLAIGSDPGGMEILLSLRAEDHGAVFCWLHADDPWGSPRNRDVYRLASSFDDFVDALCDVAEQAGRRYWSRPALERLVRKLDY